MVQTIASLGFIMIMDKRLFEEKYTRQIVKI